MKRVDNLLVKPGIYLNRSEAVRSGLSALCDAQESKNLLKRKEITPHDSFKLNKESLCYECKSLEQKNSLLTGIGNYCKSYRSEFAGDCVGEGFTKDYFGFNGCRGFEKK
jgi:Arc/MetJ-type ribon-helix-helix transcriptional regulator